MPNLPHVSKILESRHKIKKNILGSSVDEANYKQVKQKHAICICLDIYIYIIYNMIYIYVYIYMYIL